MFGLRIPFEPLGRSTWGQLDSENSFETWISAGMTLDFDYNFQLKSILIPPSGRVRVSQGYQLKSILIPSKMSQAGLAGH